jgi:hypothetical protein
MTRKGRIIQKLNNVSLSTHDRIVVKGLMECMYVCGQHEKSSRCSESETVTVPEQNQSQP